MDAKGHAKTPALGVVVKATGYCQSDSEMKGNMPFAALHAAPKRVTGAPMAANCSLVYQVKLRITPPNT